MAFGRRTVVRTQQAANEHRVDHGRWETVAPPQQDDTANAPGGPPSRTPLPFTAEWTKGTGQLCGRAVDFLYNRDVHLLEQVN